MELSALIKKQIDADERRGFPVRFGSDSERHDQLMRDLVGLIGEAGEFADLLKKVGLALSTMGYVGPSLSEAAPRLRSELADVAIYLFRLSTILDGDLEKDVLGKMKINEERYRYLER
ncbi:MazG nucleotide pyrophosphohydrolase domain-containing protein [Mesorhizobium comanense]|uniref:MazG nucleotide pyrophosphohydrolase domain-containing protein n=1 Tax=Mesorhizobium comanense TaxID=2502215 RepID=UPI0010F73A49|nr:MazG nucleotide pyrophosphohydrolase domain-containing protein [Mesorhizobium comanense]